MKIEDILSNDDYIKIPLVGNKFCKKKPSVNDKNIKIIRDTNNIYDPQALKIISIRDNNEYHLGFIIKDKIPYVNSVFDRLIFKTIIQKKNNSKVYYYLVYTLKNI